MKNVVIAAFVSLVCVALVGCATPRFDVGEAGIEFGFEPAIGPSRMQEGEAVLREAIEETQVAVVKLAEKVEGAEEVIADVKKSADNLEAGTADLAERDFTDSNWFWLIMAGLGIPLVRPAGRAGTRAAQAVGKLIAKLPQPPDPPTAAIA